MPLKTIDLNSDVGESFGNYTLGLDEEVIPLISSANIACGYHAGDPAVMRHTVALAINNGVGLGAHPGLPDLVGFGRRNMDVTLEEIKDFVTYQIGALQAVAALQGARLQHVKPHGALYNMAVKNPAIWDAVAEVMAGIDERLILFVLAGSDRAELESIAKRRGVRIAFEFFADRAYNTDGSLVSRKLPGAVIHDNDVVAAKVLKLVKEGKVKTIEGPEIELKAETICVHGDNPKALALVQKIRETLKGRRCRRQTAGRLSVGTERYGVRNSRISSHGRPQPSRRTWGEDSAGCQPSRAGAHAAAAAGPAAGRPGVRPRLPLAAGGLRPPDTIAIGAEGAHHGCRR